MQNDDEQKYYETLTSIGLSNDQIHYIRSETSKSENSYFFVITLSVFVLLAILCIIGHIIFTYVISDTLMVYRTKGIDYFFYNSLFPIHYFPMMFFWPLFSTWAYYKLLDYFPKVRARTSLKYLDNVAQIKMKHYHEKSFKDNNFHLMSFEQGLIFINRESQKWLSKYMVYLFIIALPLMALDALNYKLVTNEGVTIRDYASFQTKNHIWNDVTIVKTGCYYTRGRRSRLSLSYNMSFNDGSEINIFDFKPIQHNIIKINIIDNYLKKLEKPFSIRDFSKRFPDGRHYVNDNCFTKLREKHPSQYSEIVRLLRIQKYEPLN